jgi:photosystem I psaA/psaB protein
MRIRADGIGHSMKDLLDAHIPPGGRLGRGHKGLYDTINNSLHFQLGLALASLGVITSLVAQHMYSLPAYAFIAQDFTTQAALYTHHQYIAGFIMTGAKKTKEISIQLQAQITNGKKSLFVFNASRPSLPDPHQRVV